MVSVYNDELINEISRSSDNKPTFGLNFSPTQVFDVPRRRNSFDMLVHHLVFTALDGIRERVIVFLIEHTVLNFKNFLLHLQLFFINSRNLIQSDLS